jgi:subfamily B ATP-binding cassette protein MsbA
MAIDEQTKPQGSWLLLKRLVVEHVRPYLGRLALAGLCMMVAAGATALLAQAMEPVLDDIFIAGDRTMLIAIPLAVLAITVIKGAATYGQSVLMAWVGQRIIADLQARLFAHLMRLDLAFFHDTASGKLISRLTNDVNAMRNAVSNSLTGLVKDSLTLVFLAAVMLEKDWSLALIACVMFPLAAYPIIRIGRRMRKVSTKAFAELGLYTARLSEAFQSARHVKAYNREDFESARTSALIESVFKLIFKALRVRAASTPIMETLGGVFIALIVGYGGLQVIEGRLTTGEFFAFITAMMLAYQPLKSLANLNLNVQEGLAAAQRVFEVIDAEPSIRDRPDAVPLPRMGGAIRFADVSFSYGADSPALHHVSLEVPTGRTAALVGPSGAGKSTILNLIPRFYDVGGGAVTIGGVDVRAATLQSLRDQIALVSQEAVLFDDTVRANIAYGRLEASDREIEAAARSAGAHDFILGLPNGYESVIGEHGVKLSGGQRQRLLIARAMLKDAPILLLDEATSALDSETERQVQAALRTLMKGRTTLVIAHRLSTVLDADVIHVIEGGRVVESGSHAMLLARGGAYARLYALQFAAEETAGRDARAGAGA